MKSVVSEKGQVTIPKRLRDRLGLRPGQVLEFREQGGTLVASKAMSDDPVESVYGTVRIGAGSDELVRAMRGKPDAV